MPRITYLESLKLRNMCSLVFAWIYCCTILTGVYSRSQGTQPLDLDNMPKFLSGRNSYNYQVGQDAYLRCSVANLGARQQVVWRVASKKTPLTVGFMKFSADPRLGVDQRGTNWDLVIRNVKLEDAGVYECQISSKMKHLRHHVTLMVTEPDTSSHKPNIEISGSKYVDEGERLKLVCNASSREYPPADIDWFRGGNTVTSNDVRGISIQKHVSVSRGTIYSTLEITRAAMEDQGVYVCRTSNKDVISTQVNVLKSSKRETNKKRGTEKGSIESYTGDKSNSVRSWSFSHLSLTFTLSSIVLLRLFDLT